MLSYERNKTNPSLCNCLLNICAQTGNADVRGACYTTSPPLAQWLDNAKRAPFLGGAGEQVGLRMGTKTCREIRAAAMHGACTHHRIIVLVCLLLYLSEEKNNSKAQPAHSSRGLKYFYCCCWSPIYSYTYDLAEMLTRPAHLPLCFVSKYVNGPFFLYSPTVNRTNNIYVCAILRRDRQDAILAQKAADVSRQAYTVRFYKCSFQSPARSELIACNRAKSDSQR